MVCSAQPSWEALPPAAQPPWQALPGAFGLQALVQDMELPPLPADFAVPSPFGQAMPSPPPLRPLPLPPLPAIDQQLLSMAAPAATASQLLPSSSGSDRSTKIEQRLERMRAKNRRAQARYREKQKVGASWPAVVANAAADLKCCYTVPAQTRPNRPME